MYSPLTIARKVVSYISKKATNSAKQIIFYVVRAGQIPGHVGFIMDGNRTFAKKQRLASKDGHIHGAKTLVNSCYDLGVKEVTVYAFSIENYNRPQEEIDGIMKLLLDGLEKLSKEHVENDYKVRIRIVGNRSLIKHDILQTLCRIEDETNSPQNNRLLNVCFPYTARDDMAQSIRCIAKRFCNGEIPKDAITENAIASSLYVGEQTRPLDILVRTSGHTRLSDFLLWESSSNCSITFSPTLWPELRTLELLGTILKWSYSKDELMSRINPPSKAPGYGVRHVSLQALPKPPSFASVAPSVPTVRTEADFIGITELYPAKLVAP